MISKKKLVNGIGNHNETNRYYDNWSYSYDKTLSKWNYKAPKKACLILKSYLHRYPRNLLDLACGTGLFAEEVIKFFPKIEMDGIDISKKILDQAKNKNIYKKLIYFNFDKNFLIKKKYDVVSCIGAMTYTKNPKKLLLNIYNLTNFSGIFIFTHRSDLWKKQNYSELLTSISKKWNSLYISRPLLYLPNNIDFNNKIKFKIVVLKKC